MVIECESTRKGTIVCQPRKTLFACLFISFAAKSQAETEANCKRPNIGIRCPFLTKSDIFAPVKSFTHVISWGYILFSIVMRSSDLVVRFSYQFVPITIIEYPAQNKAPYLFGDFCWVTACRALYQWSIDKNVDNDLKLRTLCTTVNNNKDPRVHIC